MTITRTLLTGIAFQTTQLVNNNPYQRLIAFQEGYIQLYALCSVSGCAAGGCDWNGNCLNGCANSTPARIGANCTCPPGYVDNGIDAQCELAYNSTQQVTLLSSVSSQCGGESYQAAFLPNTNYTIFLAMCDNDNNIRVFNFY